MKLTDYEDNHSTLRVLITGLTGAGKTTLAATLARKYRLVWIDVENALETLSKLPQEWKANIDVYKIPDSAAFPIAAQTVQRLFKELVADICFEHGVINCPACRKSGALMQHLDLANLDPKRDIVVLDSLTQVGASFLAHLMKAAPIDAKPERDDWGGLRKNTEYLGSSIQRLPFNLVATALCIESELDDGSVRLVPAFGSKAMSSGIGAKFSTVVYCETKNKMHKAYSSSTASNMFISKSRTGYQIEKLAQPDLVPMFEEFLEGTITAQPQQSITEVVQAASISQVTTVTTETQKTDAKSILANLRNKAK